MRTDSPSRFMVVFASACALIALACALAIGAGDAAGKKKRGGGSAAVVTSTLQSQIVSSGAVTVRGGKGKVAVFAGAEALTGSRKGKPGKSRSLPLNDRGKALLGGGSVGELTAVTRFKKGRKKSRRSRTVTLTRDLGICSVPSENPTAKPYIGPPIDTANSDRCDFLDPAVCLQPWPNDYFTVADPSTDTGRRLNISTDSTPKNKNGAPIAMTDQNRGDGFSPGNPIIVKLPQVQTQQAFDNTGFVPIDNLRRYDDDNQPVVVINTETGERHPVWAEMDHNPLEPDASGNPANSNLIVRPARNFDEGGHYIVALRNLRDAQNNPVEPPVPFRVYRDRLTTQQAAVESRRDEMETIFSTLQDAGVARSNLYLAWDFTVASENSLTERALTIRDDALDRLGDTTPADGIVQGSAPDFTATATDFTPAENANVLRQVDGVLEDVPCYLNTDGCPSGAQFSFEPDGDVTWNPAFTMDVPYRCIIPRSVDGGAAVDPAKPGTYGHGLLGAYTQVNGQGRLANEDNSLWCAVDWAGFSNADLGTVITTLANVSGFNRLADRMQQGFVNFLYLGRALIHPDGFNDDAAFQYDAGSGLEPVIDTSELYFEGISQGAIMGGALTALSPDFTRAVLNVPGMNYSTLLRRSVDSDEYFKAQGIGLYENYPSELERPLLLSLMQLLWDRGEGNGYAHHMTDDPLANTPEHQVLLQPAVGDHQVTNVSAEVEARTARIPVYKPALEPGRHWESNPFMQLPGIDFGPGPVFTPWPGSALVYYDGGPTSWFNDGTAFPGAASECSNGNPATNPCQGSGVMPTAEVPPRSENGFGKDPHGYPRRSIEALQHVKDFLKPDPGILPCLDGAVMRPCYANGWLRP
ncbi:MAG: hypothetical protein ACXWGV_11295 [Solirubrobacterales bacterium]